MLGLHLEAAALDAEAAFDVVRGLGLQLEIPGIGAKKGGGSNAGPDATRSSTVGVRNARAARPNTENVLVKRCSRPTCSAYCVSLLSSGEA